MLTRWVLRSLKFRSKEKFVPWKYDTVRSPGRVNRCVALLFPVCGLTVRRTAPDDSVARMSGPPVIGSAPASARVPRKLGLKFVSPTTYAPAAPYVPRHVPLVLRSSPTYATCAP